MKKTGISRRTFVTEIAAGAFTAAVIPAWAVNKYDSVKPVKLDKSLLPPLFDCNKYIGPGFPKKPDFPKAADLLAHMNRLGIDRAVAWHTAAKAVNPMVGNKQIIQEIETANARERIIPSFVIAPSIAGDKQLLDDFLKSVNNNHIRAFHYFPQKFGWKLKDISPLIKELSPLKPVIFLDAFECLGNDTSEILDLAGEYKQASYIFINAMWGHLDALYKLMEARSNIFMDISLQHIYRANEDIIKRFGVERLIFGTGYKSNNGASIASLAHAKISSEQANRIAHRNLEALLGIKTPLEGTRRVIGDRLWHRLLRNEKLGPDYIDAHTHLCRTTAPWTDHDQADISSHARQAIIQMDNLGIESMIVAEYTVYPPDLTTGKTAMEKGLAQFGNRFHGYFSGLAFKTEKKETLIPRMDDLFSRSYYVGIKMHNSHWNIPVTDPDFTPLWEYANKHRLPILLHTWNDKVDAPKMLEDIVPRYPDAVFILGHSGNTDRLDAEKLALKNPNVYLEWCGSFVNPDDWRETLEHLGNRRILYGSDFISWESRWGHDPAWEMGRLLSLDVPDEALIPILGSNMREILSRKK